jgi:hypothetical protein
VADDGVGGAGSLDGGHGDAGEATGAVARMLRGLADRTRRRSAHSPRLTRLWRSACRKVFSPEFS